MADERVAKSSFVIGRRRSTRDRVASTDGEIFMNTCKWKFNQPVVNRAI